MNTTQEHLRIKNITNDILLLKDGGGALVLQVSAVNFGLLSVREQLAIIFSFAQMLNSLNHSIQILIFSERLNISSYLNLLNRAQQAQINPLLSRMIGNYREFIQTTISENDVLDKKFFVIIPLYSLELGLTSSQENLEQKIRTVLLPRRDQMIRQLARVGLKAAQLTNQKLIELLYDIYNGQFVETIPTSVKPAWIDVNLKEPKQRNEQPTTPTPAPPIYNKGQITKNHPFIVEELDEKV